MKIDNIECQSIIIKHPDSEGSIQLEATPNGIGIWLTKNGNRKSPMISIYSFNGQTAIGITSNKLINSNKCYELSLSVNERTNEPIIQMVTEDDQVISLSAEQVRQLVKDNNISSFV